MLATKLRLPVSLFFAEGPLQVSYAQNGMAWRITGRCHTTRERAIRVAGDQLLAGASMKEIGAQVNMVRGGAEKAPLPEAAEISWMATSAFRLGLVRMMIGEDPDKVLNHALGKALEKKLNLVEKGAGGVPCRVFVVKNMCDASFRVDPSAPFVVARYAHHLVANRLETSAYTVGLSGGSHVSAFVSTADGESSLVPDKPGSDRRLTLVPITLEPFPRHDYPLSDALVGELTWRLASLIGPERVTAYTFKPAGFLVNRRPGVLDTESVVLVRAQYVNLDIAIYGCGSLESHAMTPVAMQTLGIAPQDEYATDVCLNPIDQAGNPIPLLVSSQEETGHREWLGVNLQELRAVAADERKLSLMLTSGAHKGKAIVAAARSGATNAIVCDERAAASALENAG